MALNIRPYLLDMYPHVVVYEAPVGTDEQGDPTGWGTPVNLTARVKGRARMVRDLNGTEQLSTVQASLAEDYGVLPQGRFTLPSRWQPNQPKAINVKTVPDENGDHHQTVFFP